MIKLGFVPVNKANVIKRGFNEQCSGSTRVIHSGTFLCLLNLDDIPMN